MGFWLIRVEGGRGTQARYLREVDAIARDLGWSPAWSRRAGQSLVACRPEAETLGGLSPHKTAAFRSYVA